MENKKLIWIALPLVMIALFGVLAVSFISPGGLNSDTEVQYGSNVCTYVTRSNGDVEQLGCSSNLVTDAGLEHIEKMLGNGGGGGTFDYIALCNATISCVAPAAGDTTLENEYAAGGLSRAQGTYGDLGTGNWSMYKTFTATDNSIETNKTGIFNASSAGTLLAENTFTLVTLQNNDQLTVNWTISVTNP